MTADVLSPTAQLNNEPTTSAGEDAALIGDESLQSRGEKKARRSLSKLGLSPMPLVNRVVMKRSKTVLFVLGKPQVFCSASGVEGGFVVFGEARIEDMSQNGQRGALQSLAASQTADAQNKAGEEEDVPELEEINADAEVDTKSSADEGEVDETGLKAADIELVMTQASVSRARAARMLKKCNNDIVNAIMELSM